MFKNRRVFAAGAMLFAAVSLSACGGSTKTVTVSAAPVTVASSTTTATGAGATSTATSATPPSGPQPCSQSTHFKSGLKCTENGNTLTFVHQGDTLRLKTLTAQVTDVHTTTSLANSISSVTAKGAFVIITLNITNKTSTPETIATPGNQQTVLVGHKAQYSEDFDAENGPDQNSCINQNGTSLQPGASQSCDVVYDIPTPAVTRARTHRFGLLVGNFGADFSSNAYSPVTVAGLFDLNPIGSS